MSRAVETYLDRVMQSADIRNRQEAELIRAEQRDHLEEKIERLKNEDVAAEDAVFQAIDEHGDPVEVGYGLRPAFPLVDIRARGTARGIIAIGPRAYGVFAFGGFATGIFAFGGLSMGIFTVGGLTAALLFSWGGVALVPCGVAYAGVGLAPIAFGGTVAGIVAAGGLAIGMYAMGGVEVSHYTADTAPEWMRTIISVFPPLVESAAFHIGTISVFLLVLAVTNLFSFRELQRVKDISPRSV